MAKQVQRCIHRSGDAHAVGKAPRGVFRTSVRRHAGAVLTSVLAQAPGWILRR